MENVENIPVSPENIAAVITTQPMMNDPTDEVQEEIKQRKEEQDIMATIEEVADDCTWCCFSSASCSPNCDCACCDNCCDECCTGCGDCCFGCCEDGPSLDNIDVDGDDASGCLDCCGTCFECIK